MWSYIAREVTTQDNEVWKKEMNSIENSHYHGAKSVSAQLSTEQEASISQVDNFFLNELVLSVTDFVQAFDLFDTDGRDSLDANELSLAIYSMGFADRKHSRQMATRFLKQIGKGDGPINKTDFRSFMLAGLDQMEEIRAIFKALCEDGKSRISQDSLERMVQKLGLTISKEEVRDLIYTADIDNDGLVEEKEFMWILSHSTWM